jgi:hypothetical protein
MQRFPGHSAQRSEEGVTYAIIDGLGLLYACLGPVPKKVLRSLRIDADVR